MSEYPPGEIPGFDWIAEGLYQGSAPPPGLRGFDTIVLCAEEYQPSHLCYPTSEVIYAPNDDAKLNQTQADIAQRAARIVARHLREGKTVLVTCMQGRNRSGLVSALALMRHRRVPAKRAIHMVQSQRRTALTNPHFLRYLERAEI